MKLMLDVNIVLDVVQKRVPHYKPSAKVMSSIVVGKHIGYLPAHAITTVHYLISKYSTTSKANETIDWLLLQFNIAAITKESLLLSRTLLFDDFEDAVVATVAKEQQCEYIITRNVQDFRNSPVKVITPEEFLSEDFKDV